MTNSNQDERRKTTGEPETTTPDTGKFISEKGTEFVITTANNGLFFIKMKKGGLAPAFCHEFFTSKQEAEKVLERYLLKTNRIGHLL